MYRDVPASPPTHLSRSSTHYAHRLPHGVGRHLGQERCRIVGPALSLSRRRLDELRISALGTFRTTRQKRTCPSPKIGLVEREEWSGPDVSVYKKAAPQIGRLKLVDLDTSSPSPGEDLPEAGHCDAELRLPANQNLQGQSLGNAFCQLRRNPRSNDKNQVDLTGQCPSCFPRGKYLNPGRRPATLERVSEQLRLPGNSSAYSPKKVTECALPTRQNTCGSASELDQERNTRGGRVRVDQSHQIKRLLKANRREQTGKL